MSRFTSTKVINSRWRNNDFIGAAGSSHTFPDQFHDEFLVDWAQQIADGSIIITETPTTGNIQMATLTVGDIVLTGTATGNFGGSTIIGTSPISVSTASNTSTISLNANYQTAGTYVTSVSGTAPITSSGTTAITVGIDQTAITSAAATSALNMRTFVRNATASTIAKGSVVYLSSSNGIVPTIEKALATADATSSRTFGIVQADISANSNGYVINQGIIDPIDTSGIADGSVLWLSTTVAGGYSTVKPVGPNHGVLVGVCVKGNSVGNGSIYIFIKNGAELDEIHDVNVSGMTNGQALVWSSSQSVWVNQSINTAIASVSGTAPIVVTTNTDKAVTVSVSTGTTSATVAFGDHLHAGIYQPAGTYVASSTVTTKGDLLVGASSSSVTRLGAGTDGYILTARSTATNGLAWEANSGGVTSVTGTAPIVSSGGATPAISITAASTSASGAVQLTDSISSTSTTTAATPNSVKTTYDIATAGWEAFNFGATGIIATVPRFVLTTTTVPTSGTIYFTRLLPHRAFVVSNISFVAAGTATVTPTLIRFGIYTRSGSTYTLVARTDSDTTIFSAQHTKYTRALSTAGGYPATYSLTAGAEYWIAVIQVASTTAAVLTATGLQATAANIATGSQTVTKTGQTDLPSSSTVSTASTNGGFYAEVS